MRARGITYENTGKIILQGTEASVGSDIKIVINNSCSIQEIWDTIYQSRPYSIWYASGYLPIEFYQDENSTIPVLILLLNESGAAHINGMDKSFYCPGLDKYVMNLLMEEYNKKNKSEN